MDQQQRVFRKKKVATKVKHAILTDCLNAWGGIIVNSNKDNSVRLAFVDTCCGSGLYEPGDDNADVDFDAGSALIGLTALEKLVAYGRSLGQAVTGKALFVNRSQGELDTLTAAARSLSDASVTFKPLCGELSTVVDDVTSFCKSTFAFIFVDPYGPSAIPFSVVSRLVRLRRADCLINFPYYSVHKWIGWLGTGKEEARLRRVDDLMNGPAWRELVVNAPKGASVEMILLGHYMKQLTGCGVGAMALPMLFEDKSRTMYHLVFTSHSTAGLASAKEKFMEGASQQAAMRFDLKAKKRQQGTLDFMTVDSEQPDLVDINKLSDVLAIAFSERSATTEEVIGRGLQEPYVLEKHVRRALTVLKKAGAISFTSPLRYHDRLVFARRSTS